MTPLCNDPQLAPTPCASTPAQLHSQQDASPPADAAAAVPPKTSRQQASAVARNSEAPAPSTTVKAPVKSQSAQKTTPEQPQLAVTEATSNLPAGLQTAADEAHTTTADAQTAIATPQNVPSAAQAASFAAQPNTTPLQAVRCDAEAANTASQTLLPDQQNLTVADLSPSSADVQPATAKAHAATGDAHITIADAQTATAAPQSALPAPQTATAALPRNAADAQPAAVTIQHTSIEQRQPATSASALPTLGASQDPTADAQGPAPVPQTATSQAQILVNDAGVTNAGPSPSDSTSLILPCIAATPSHSTPTSSYSPPSLGESAPVPAAEPPPPFSSLPIPTPSLHIPGSTQPVPTVRPTAPRASTPAPATSPEVPGYINGTGNLQPTDTAPAQKAALPSHPVASVEAEPLAKRYDSWGHLPLLHNTIGGHCRLEPLKAPLLAGPRYKPTNHARCCIILLMAVAGP